MSTAKKGDIQLEKVKTTEQQADNFLKCITRHIENKCYCNIKSCCMLLFSKQAAIYYIFVDVFISHERVS